MDNSFLGKGWSFPPEFNGKSKSVRMVSGKGDIDESLRILMETRFQERVMQPAYGCGLKSLVFESMNESTLTQVREAIQRAVLFFEPRIDLESVEIDEGRADEGMLFITLNYKIRITNTRSNLVYPFYFLEGTNVSA